MYGNRTNYTLANAGAQVLENSYTYDNLNRLTGVTNAGETTSYSYDANGSVLYERTGTARHIYYTYNAAGLLTNLENKVDWDDSRNRITITNSSLDTPIRHYYLDDSENLIVTDAGWNIIKTCKLRGLKNLDAILAECPGYIDDFERQYHGFIGGYGGNAYVKILCVKETKGEKQANARIYEYNLMDDSFRLIEDSINGEASDYRMMEDKLLMWDDSKYVIYDTATCKKTEIPSGSQIQLTLDGNYIYYFLTTDGDKNIVYKQRIDSEEKEVLVQMPFPGCLRIVDGWLYCIDTTDYNHFARVRLNGQNYEGE